MTKKIFKSTVLVSAMILILGSALVMGILYRYFGKQLDGELEKEASYLAYGVEQSGVNYLEHLKQKGYPMVLVSNFYGNINQVLKDAGIDGYFEDVIESAVVGVRKPNPAIFALGVCALDLPASQVLVVGDTYGKDIVPAHKLGLSLIHI